MAYQTTTLTAERAWITLAAAPSGAYVRAGTRMTGSVDRPLDGEIRHFAGGRIQAAVFDQDDTTTPVVLAHLSMADVQTLLGWRGRTVLLRTVDGQRHHGVFWNVPYQRFLDTTPETAGSTDTTTYDVDLSLQRVTFSEVV